MRSTSLPGDIPRPHAPEIPKLFSPAAVSVVARKIARKHSLVLAVSLLGACTSVPKASTPGPVCTKFDTSEVLFSYGPAIAREQTIQDLAKRVNRDLSDELSEDSIPQSTEPCRQSDAVLTVRIDSLETIESTKSFLGVGAAVVAHVQMKYVATFVSPTGEKLFDSDDNPTKESLDDLASHVASSLYKELREFYLTRKSKL
jgi:hypothetical protein